MDKDTKFRDWLPIAEHARFKVGKYSRPEYVGDKPTPKSLGGLTIGQLIDLSKLTDSSESIYTITETILGLKRADIDRARAVDVVRFVGWVSSEVEKINKLFETTEKDIKTTDIEKRAGIETLRFGLFGMLDWYAVRMGISDHDAVLQTPWLRIYKCMDMDNKRRAYEMRLQHIQAEEMRRNTKTR